MEIILETKRLLLRELTYDDKENLSLVFTDPESMKYYPKPFTDNDVEKWIKWNQDNYKQYGFGLWAVILKEENEFIGDCGITMQEIEGIYLPEIGYHIRKEYCQKGYASEAAKACIQYAFNQEGINSVISYMKEDNIPSRKVAEKNGMNFIKYFEKVVKGEVVREALYRINKEI